MKKIIFILITICCFQVIQSQNIDEATVNKIRVKLIGAEKLYEQRKYHETLDKIKEIEAISEGLKSAKIQNLKVKAYLGWGVFQSAKVELDKLYKMNPNDAIIKDIASYESKINQGINDEKERKERERLAEIERNEAARIAEIKREEDARLAEIQRKEEARKANEKAEWLAAVKKAIDRGGAMHKYGETGYDYKFLNQTLLRINHKNKWGFINIEGEIIVPIKYDFVGIYTPNHVCLVKMNGKWGAINEVGKEVIPIIYEDIQNDDYNREYFIANLKGKAGLLNSNNEILIPFRFDKISQVDDSGYYFYAEIGERKIKFNRKGEEVKKFDGIHLEFSEGLAVVKEEDESGFIISGYVNESKELVIPIIYQRAYSFEHGIAIVQNMDSKWGCINTKGEIVIPFEYDDMGLCYRGLLKVTKNSLKGIVNREGNIIAAIKYNEIDNLLFNNGSSDFMYVTLNEKEGVLNKYGKEIIPPIYDDFYWLSKNYLRSELNGKFGVFNRMGEIIIPVEFERFVLLNENLIKGRREEDGNYIHFDSNGERISGIAKIGTSKEGLIRAIFKDKYGFLNERNKVIIPFEFDDAENFTQEGIAMVEKSGKYGIINRKGKIIVPIIYNDVNPEFVNGMIEAIKYGEYSNSVFYYDKKGKLLN
tara:strand:- start:5662 stop:7608 length:1947 start_codon:yes stop_codon:yes gene_type:complete